jgi:hypothetical protein
MPAITGELVLREAVTGRADGWIRGTTIGMCGATGADQFFGSTTSSDIWSVTPCTEGGERLHRGLLSELSIVLGSDVLVGELG